jgi:hypothetical protein
MKSDEFWSVQLGVGMGPLVLGTEYQQVLNELRDQHIDVDGFATSRMGGISLTGLKTELVFSQDNPQTLCRIDVSDERLRFGSLPVIGKRAYEIVGLFKVPRKETLWCSIDPEIKRSEFVEGDQASRSRALLHHGTIWITGHGLGLTLSDGLVATVHLCDPSHSPRDGHGTWTKEQQRLSEVREIPVASLPISKPLRSSAATGFIHLALFVSLGVLAWRAIQLQQRWNAAPEVPAVVVALNPPPPSVLPNTITVLFKELSGTEHRQALGFMQFEQTPKMGEEVQVRYLPESPDMVLGPVACRSVGIDMAIPYGIGILAAYSLLQLIVLVPWRSRLGRKT